ncbi:uncharacterized protein LOC126797269 [Argentina anserina]|uniref:uncharacterized protein LOC126797269 n=1 Tax=Argentina anserina TaxID=57926 RepID=UPI0021767B3C|nr:uncharacterized protein LOC126797269 [Potentilla anserina]
MALEFKSYKDDAWYDARVVAEGRRYPRLRIKFCNFDDDEDECVYAKDLKSLQDVGALRSRFRKISGQFQDSDCSRVEPGLPVCASRRVGADELKFYDAVLTGVVKKEHRVSKGGELVCTCTFNVDWIDSGQPGSCRVEKICRVEDTTDEELDPALILFLHKARERISRELCTPCRISGGGAYDLRPQHKASFSPTVKSICTQGMGTDSDINPLRNSYEVGSDHKRRNKDTSHTTTLRKPLALSYYVEGMSGNASDMDGRDGVDVGGALYMVLIENLENEISPFTILEFIQQHVSITCQASVSPSKSMELYTRAIILLNSKENLEKLSNFLESPDHVIISSTGRPWLMTEKRQFPETLRASIQSFIIFSQTSLERRTLGSNELKVVLSGNQGYMEAKERQKVVKEFTEHQCGLHRRLGLEEGKISLKYR